MANLKDIIFISIQDGYYNISLYFPNENSNSTVNIKTGDFFTYHYDGIKFDLFKDYSDKIYAISDINAFEHQMNNFPKHLYKFEYEELAYLTIRELFEISLKRYKTYNPNESKSPVFKFVFSDCYKIITHKNKSLYTYFCDAISQNMSLFKNDIDDLTIDLASNVYPYYLYGDTIYNNIGAPTNLKTDFKHCFFDIGYTTTTCYIYQFKTKIIKENLTNFVNSKERSVIISHELQNVFTVQAGIFDFISSIYYELLKAPSKIIHSNSSYEYSYEIQNLILESVKNLSLFNSTNYVYFKDSFNYYMHNIHLENIYNTSIINNIVEKISNNIKTFNIDSYHINSIISFRWFFDEFLNLNLFDTNGYSTLLNDSLFYKYGIINNLIYRTVVLTGYPDGLESHLNKDDIYEKEDKRLCRKRTSTMPELNFDTNTYEIKLKPINDIINYIQLYDYINELSRKYYQILNIKNKFSKIKSKLSKIYGFENVNGVYNKLILLSLNEPTLLKKYLNDFSENPETYL